MEEFVGGLWHKLVTRAAEQRFPDAAVRLADMEKTAGVLFRALGGEAGLRVAAAADTRHGARRRWLARIAGSGERCAHAALDSETLQLPDELAIFPERALNRDLYVWLIALAAADSELRASPAALSLPLDGGQHGRLRPCCGVGSCRRRRRDAEGKQPGRGGGGAETLHGDWNRRPPPPHPPPSRGREDPAPAHPPGGPEQPDAAAPSWIARNQAATLRVLARYPGLRARYRRLVVQLLSLRIPPERLPADEGRAERAIRDALAEPGSVADLPAAVRPPQPVPLWLYPSPGGREAAARGGEAAPARENAARPQAAQRKRHRAERVDAPEGKDGFLMMFRAESLLSWAEFIKVNRPHDDDPDADPAAAANDLDRLSVTREGETTPAHVRFDLDLPAAAQDDTPLGAGMLLPEWDYRKRVLKPAQCRVQPLVARDAPPVPLPARLRPPAQRLRAQFAALVPVRHWRKGQPDGPELDMDACVRAHADRHAGSRGAEQGVYLAQAARERDLACLVLADLSLSTDAWIGEQARVIDVIRDSLMLFGEALAATGDRYAFYGFSSVKREQVRLHRIKPFAEAYGAAARGRIAALKPGYYTRMGAAIRYAAGVLAEQHAASRLLLILTDGKPNDLDHYEGRYGVEDTRVAVLEARRQGLRPFCVTIDREGAAYLPHLFGPAGYTVIRKPEELPARLPLLYAQLTAG